MRFRVWFLQWIGAFYKLLTFGTKVRKSDYQRKKERERRLKAKRLNPNLHPAKKRRRRRTPGHIIQNRRLLNVSFHFIAVSLGVLLLPLGLLDWGRKSAKVRKASGSRRVSKNATSKPKTSPTCKQNAPQETKTRPSEIEMHEIVDQKLRNDFNFSAPKTNEGVEHTSMPKLDESTPKSVPKNEKDSYIRKRMIIAGTNYCEKAVLDSLVVGAVIDLEAEPNNPHDKDAVKLLYRGQRIGYIARTDRLSFATCLKRNRRIYGVITDIYEENGRTNYEFETWFEN